MRIWGEGLSILGILAGILLLALHQLLFCRLRIYNWDGKRYRFVGRAGIRRVRGAFEVMMPERTADLSWTTDYRLVPGRSFVRQNRYRDMMVCAGKMTVWVPVEESMQAEIYYRYQTPVKNR